VVTIRDGRTSSESVRKASDVEAALAQDAVASVPVYEEYVVVDEAGRLQIPPDLRAELNIGRRVTLEKTGDGVLIRPVDGVSPIVVPNGTSTSGLDDQPPAARFSWVGLSRMFKTKKQERTQ
jgi:bifunctional DNA-binding transcriptional regulator/antitoxin component of YhaV-PrlF toxin-antitoxin module